MMKVSILVPVYGVEKYIGQCAESLFGQTYEDIEYIFVDDCSPDRSMEVLQEVLGRFPHRQQQVRMIRHDHNRGLGATRSSALQQATGDAVMIVDSDDYIATTAVDKLVNALQTTGADIVDCAYSLFSGSNILSTTLPCTDDDVTYLRKMLIHNTVSHNVWARIYRRRLFADYGLSTVEGVNQGEDYSLVPRLLFHGRRATIPDVLYYYRLNDYGTFADSLSSRHIRSYVQANAITCHYIKAHDGEGRYAFAVDLGLLQVYYHALQAGMTIKEVDDVCGTPGNPWVRAIRLLASSHTIPLLRLAYLVAKRLYLQFFI